MKNKIITITISTILASSAVMTYCQSNTIAGNNQATSANAAKSHLASTPTKAYKAAYAARKKKNIQALKRLISKDMFEFLEMIGEGKRNPLEAGLKELIKTPQAASDQTRNEIVTGDKATLEYIDTDGSWKKMDLVKEDGIWKLTIAREKDDEESK